MKTVAINPETAIRVLKTGACQSLSGNGKLGYQVGCEANGSIHFRIHSNTGGGNFSNEWVPWSGIQQALDKSPSNKAITSHVLQKLFRAKTINSYAFLASALQNEGLLKASKEKKRRFERNDPKEFISRIKALMRSSAETKVVGNPKKALPGKKTTPKSTKKK